MTYNARNRHLITLLWDAETHQVIAAPHHSSSSAPAGQTWRQRRPTDLVGRRLSFSCLTLQSKPMHDRYFRTVYRLSEGRINDLRETVWCAAGLDLTLAGCFWSRAAWSGAGRFGWLTVLLHALPTLFTPSAGRSRTPGCSPLTSMACAAIGTVGSARRTSYPRNRSGSLRRWLTASRVPSQRRPRVAPYSESASPPRPRRVLPFLPFLLSSIVPFPPRQVLPVLPFLLFSTHNAAGCTRALHR